VSCNDEIVVGSYPLLCLQRQVAKLARAAFFNLFAAAEPSANVCVAHGTLAKGSITQKEQQVKAIDKQSFQCDSQCQGYCKTVVLLKPLITVVASSVPGNFGLFRRNPG